MAWRICVRGNNLFLYLGIGLIIVGLQVAVGSRAGMAISSILFAASLLWAYTLESHRVIQLVCFLISTIAIAAVYSYWSPADALDIGVRELYFQQSWEIAKNFWLTGTGLGSFSTIWPVFENFELLEPKYITHVHNDHLELFIELGVIYFLLLVSFLFLIARNAFRNELNQAVAISILAILVHSVFDYPLRTYAISIVFVFLAAIILAKQPASKLGNGQEVRRSHKKKINKEQTPQAS